VWFTDSSSNNRIFRYGAAQADTTAPIVTGAADRQPDSGNWYNHDVTINWTATDPDSTATTPASTTASTEGANVTYTSDPSCDPSNNCATGNVQLSIDKTPPSVTSVSWSANPLLQGQNTILTAAATDALSGVGSVQYSINGSSPQSMTYDSPSNTWTAFLGSNLAVNTYDIDVTAVDNAGNVSPAYKDVLAVYNAANGYVTGHEWIQPSATDTLPITTDASNNPAKLVVGFSNVRATSPASGTFSMHYVIKNNYNEFDLSSTSVQWVVVPNGGTQASILGTGDLTTYVNGINTVTQGVSVRFDITLGSNGSPDHVTIKIFNPGVNPNSGTPSYVINDDTIPNRSHTLILP
jgi:hypothetical protein